MLIHGNLQSISVRININRLCFMFNINMNSGDDWRVYTTKGYKEGLVRRFDTNDKNSMKFQGELRSLKEFFTDYTPESSLIRFTETLQLTI